MKKRILLSILFIPTLILFSCGGVSDPYKDKIVITDTQIKVTGSIKTNYTETDNKISPGDLKFTFINKDKSEQEIQYFDSDDETIPLDKFFITTSTDTPTLSRIKKNNTMSTSKPSYTTKVYVAVVHKEDNVDKVFVYKNGFDITITNSKAINPVLYYVGSAVLFVAIGVLIYIIQKKKNQSLNNIDTTNNTK